LLLLDPHGDLAEELLDYIPSWRSRVRLVRGQDGADALARRHHGQDAEVREAVVLLVQLIAMREACGRSFKTVLRGPHGRATPGREAQLFRACF